jgi:hypothetical protein
LFECIRSSNDIFMKQIIKQKKRKEENKTKMEKGLRSHSGLDQEAAHGPPG